MMDQASGGSSRSTALMNSACLSSPSSALENDAKCSCAVESRVGFGMRRELAACGAPPTTRAGRGPAYAGLNECPTSPRSRPGRWPTKSSGHQTESSVRMAPRDADREISDEQIHVGLGARRGAGCRGRRHDRGTGDGPGLRRRCRTSLRSSRDGARSRRSTTSGSWDRAAAQQQSKCRAFGSFDRARAAAPCLTP